MLILFASIRACAESMGSVMEAAGRLQLGVFASGPLQEAALLQNSGLEVSSPTIYVVRYLIMMAHPLSSMLLFITITVHSTQCFHILRQPRC